MPARSAADATRFTPTTPHASIKPPASAASKPLLSRHQRTPGPAGETPVQRVARLRAAAAKAREADVSTFDRVVIRGRVWADRAHRFTALSLIGITGICGVVTVYALGDMMIHNRRKRTEYFAQQKALHDSVVYDAQVAAQNGLASESQLQLLNEEMQLKQETEAKKAAKGVFTKSKEWLFSGLKKDEGESDFGKERTPGEVVVDAEEWTQESGSKILKAVNEKKVEAEERIQDKATGFKDKARNALEKEKELERRGGPLDRLGTSASDGTATSESGNSWLAFMGRK